MRDVRYYPSTGEPAYLLGEGRCVFAWESWSTSLGLAQRAERDLIEGIPTGHDSAAMDVDRGDGWRIEATSVGLRWLLIPTKEEEVRAA